MIEYISRIKAQKILGCNKETMMRLIRSGEFETSRKDNGGWLISYDSLVAFKKRSSDKVESITELQKIIATYKEENRVLKRLLSENGIPYKGAYDDHYNIAANTAIIDLNIPKRALVSLDLAGIHSIDQLRRMSIKDLKSLDGIGSKTAGVIKAELDSKGLSI